MKLRYVFVALVVSALLAVGLSAQAALAQTGTGTPTGASTNVVTLAAGQSASIPTNFWCLDFGKPFPTGITGPSGVAPAKVVSVLAAAKSQNTINTDPYQTQLAVWYAADGTWHDTGNAGHVLAQKLVDAAASATPAPAVANQSLGALMGQGGLKVSVQNFQAVADNTAGTAVYHGTGNLLVTNSSAQSVSFVLDGAVFQPTDAGAQTLFAQTANTPQIVTATVVPTQAATATVVVAPTTAAIATVVAVPTTAATATVVVVPTRAAVATLAVTPATLPVTGGADNGGWLWLMALIGTLALFTGLRLARSRA